MCCNTAYCDSVAEEKVELFLLLSKSSLLQFPCTNNAIDIPVSLRGTLSSTALLCLFFPSPNH
jgi:hypothetical protein